MPTIFYSYFIHIHFVSEDPKDDDGVAEDEKDIDKGDEDILVEGVGSVRNGDEDDNSSDSFYSGKFCFVISSDKGWIGLLEWK